MISLSFTTEQMRELITVPIIRDQIILLAEKASRYEREHEHPVLIPALWFEIGLREEMITPIINAARTSGGKIAAIKMIRALCAMGLKESKDCFEQFIQPMMQSGGASGFVVPDEEEQ